MSTALVGLDPRTTPRTSRSAVTELPARPASLAGATIGIIGNGLNRGDELLRAIVTAIAERVEIAGVLVISKSGVSVPPDPDDWTRLLAHATVVLTGYGGCGSCSSRSMRDAIELEAAKVPAAAVIHEALTGSAAAMARISGMPDYPFAVVPGQYKSIATWSDEEIQDIARTVVPDVIALLTGSAE